MTKPIDALLGAVTWVAGFIADHLPDGHLSLPDVTPLNDVLGQLDSLIPISGPLAAAVVVLSLVVVFVVVRLVLTLWNLIWP